MHLHPSHPSKKQHFCPHPLLPHDVSSFLLASRVSYAVEMVRSVEWADTDLVHVAWSRMSRIVWPAEMQKCDLIRKEGARPNDVATVGLFRRTRSVGRSSSMAPGIFRFMNSFPFIRSLSLDLSVRISGYTYEYLGPRRSYFVGTELIYYKKAWFA